MYQFDGMNTSSRTFQLTAMKIAVKEIITSNKIQHKGNRLH